MITCSILEGDVMDGLRSLPDNSVQMCVTSPPYYGLRNYGVDGQIGLEKSPEEFVAKMVEVFREVRRVLRYDGTCWLNLGDSYAGSGCGSNDHREDGASISKNDEKYQGQRPGTPAGLKAKDMIGIPWRVAFALQADGWYLRSEIIWHKPNPMPESVTDRPTKSHEQIFLLSKSSRYFYDADAVREEQTGNAHSRGNGITPKTVKDGSLIKANESFHRSTAQYVEVPGGRNIRTVWTITTQPRPEAHSATFPDELAETCIKAGTSEYGCCPKCGTPYRRIVEATGGKIGASWHPHENDEVTGQKGFKEDGTYRREFKGWQPGCKCDAGAPVPCVVLDPFMGSGTVAVVARDLNRSSVGCELNPEYVKIIRKRLQMDQQLETGIVEYSIRKADKEASAA